MHVQIVTFQLKDLSEEAFIGVCNDVAPAFAEIPGLISKTFLINSDEGTYGGVYLWRDRAAMETFAASELFASVAQNPHLVGPKASDFGVLEGPTAVTRGLVVAAA